MALEFMEASLDKYEDVNFDAFKVYFLTIL